MWLAGFRNLDMSVIETKNVSEVEGMGIWGLNESNLSLVAIKAQ